MAWKKTYRRCSGDRAEINWKTSKKHSKTSTRGGETNVIIKVKRDFTRRVSRYLLLKLIGTGSWNDPDYFFQGRAEPAHEGKGETENAKR